MRELKFRAWSKTSKKYNYKVLVGNNNPKDKNYTCNLILSDGKWLHFDEFCGDIEQYTGVKDKNGTEIYEGDIIKVERDGTIYRVEWLYSGFGLEPRHNAPYYPSLGNVELREKIEVIGNVHQNPELVEGK